MDRIAVVGASLAGVHAAEALRERGFEGELTLISAENRLPYDRPPLSKGLLLGSVESEQIALKPETWYAENDIRLRLGVSAQSFETTARRIVLADGNSVEYDGVVLATGSVARVVASPPGGPIIHVLRTMDDALRLRPEFVAGRHLVAIGGGFISLEVAAVARALGLDVTILERATTPLSRLFGKVIGAWYRELHERNGVSMVCGNPLESIEPTANGATLVLRDGTRLSADIVVAGIGSFPATDWLAGSGVDLLDGVLCHPDLSTSVADVVAAGDIARWHNPLFGEQMRIEHWSNAVEQGRHAAATLLGDREAYCAAPYFWTDQHGTKMRFVGRTTNADETRVEEMTDKTLIATFGRGGVLIGAVCVGAPRQLALYTHAIKARTPWDESATELSLAR